MVSEYGNYGNMKESKIWNSEVGFALRPAEVGNILNAEAAVAFWDHPAIFTPSGKDAIKLILQQIGIQPHQEVYISSTFGTRYVSRCVTSVVFNFCQPSKVWTDQTNAAFVIHEYGVPHPEIDVIQDRCRTYGIPLIEDCAHSIDSRFPDGTRIGTKGDFALFSLKKVISIPGGGLALGDIQNQLLAWNQIDMMELANQEWRLSGELARLPEATKKRRENFRILEEFFVRMGLETLFTLTEGLSPFLFVVKPPSYRRFCQLLQEKAPFADALAWFGLECVSLPIHQGLSPDDMRYLITWLEDPIRKFLSNEREHTEG